MRLALSQRLTLTPALQQAIRMLQLSTLDLKTEIQNVLESNFMLEAEEPESIATSQTAATDEIDSAGNDPQADIPDNLPIDANWDDIYANNSTATTHAPAGDDQDWRDYQQANLTETPSLQSHLAWQADMHSFTPLERHAANHIIDAIDDNGLLGDWPELSQQLTREYELQPRDSERILAVIQAFDPPGVGARDLSECLAIQLRQMDAATDSRALALDVVENGHLAAIAQGRTAALARRLGVTEQALAAAHALLRTLNPRPGEVYGQTQADYVIPEVFAVRQQSGWQVLLNPDIAPRLRINSHYLGLIGKTSRGEERATLKSHLQEARFFLHSLKSRNETLLRVAQCIVEAQRGFLDYGEEAMRPLVLRDVSNLLNIHESTVSRATANKYIQTPRGIFELKYFFTSQVATSSGGHASAIAIQAMIKRMIAKENPGKPLSDSALANMLRDSNGIKVARRTVAKYREELAIAPSHQRRRNAPS